jgi:hypothetical protein
MASALDDSGIGNIDRSVVNVSDIEDVDREGWTERKTLVLGMYSRGRTKECC